MLLTIFCIWATGYLLHRIMWWEVLWAISWINTLRFRIKKDPGSNWGCSWLILQYVICWHMVWQSRLCHGSFIIRVRVCRITCLCCVEWERLWYSIMWGRGWLCLKSNLYKVWKKDEILMILVVTLVKIVYNVFRLKTKN